MGSHAAVAAELLEDRALVDAVLDDHRNAPISDADKFLFDFIERINTDSPSIEKSELDQLRSLGWSDEALYDAITVCALFNFYNKWVGAAGVQDMPAADYQESGRRMKNAGYKPEGE